MEWDAAYVKLLRKGLDAAGLANVKIILADGDWSPAPYLFLDSELANSIYAIGYELACYSQYFTTCTFQ